MTQKFSSRRQARFTCHQKRNTDIKQRPLLPRHLTHFDRHLERWNQSGFDRAISAMALNLRDYNSNIIEASLNETSIMDSQQSQSMESLDLALDAATNDEHQQVSGGMASRLDANLMGLHDVKPTFEPLKVCLDDDSSIEDGDEDMFDDDAFYFGDEDFQALLSRTPTKAPVSPRILTSCTMLNQNTFLPLHNNVVGAAPETTEHVHCIDSAASSTTGGMTSSGPSSASLGNMTLLSQESALSHMSSNSASKKPRSKRRVSLHSDVAVVPIPSRTDYPSLVRERIWSSATELYQNAARNSIEFASEGWNWRNVTEDDKMIMSPSGERIHPIHLMHSLSQGAALNTLQEHDDCKIQAKVEPPVNMDTEVISS